MTPHDKRSKMFLSVGEFPERGAGRPDGAAVAELTFSMSSRALSLLPQRSFLSPRVAVAIHGYSGRAAILSRAGPGALLVPSHSPLISPSTYRLALPSQGQRLTSDEVGLSPVNVVSHFVQATPPGTLMVPCRNQVPTRGGADWSPRASSGYGAWPTIRAET